MPSTGITLIREQVETILTTAWPDALYLNDRLHESLGHDGKTRMACSPESEGESNGNANMETYAVLVQYYLPYDKKVDPEQVVDPAVIEGLAGDFKRALKDQLGINDDTAWFFRVINIRYPKDPTGNKTRFEADVIGYGWNETQV